MKAQTIAEVVAGEMSWAGTPEQSYADALGIASVMANRAVGYGLTIDQVAKDQSQFNAFNRALPPGVGAKQIALAQRALDAVAQGGPVIAATHYATPAATKNIKGWDSFDVVDKSIGHVFAYDPQNRPLNTQYGVLPAVPEAQGIVERAWNNGVSMAKALAKAPAAAAKMAFHGFKADDPKYSSVPSSEVANFNPNKANYSPNLISHYNENFREPAQGFPDAPTPSTAPQPTARPNDYTPQSNLSGYAKTAAQVPGRPRQGPIRGVTIHHTASEGVTADQHVAAWGKSGIGAHYHVDKAGNITQTADPNSVVGHMTATGRGKQIGLNNADTIGVEVEAADDAHVSNAQRAAVAGLIDHIQAEHPEVGDNIAGHGFYQNEGLGSHARQATEGQTIANDYADMAEARRQEGLGVGTTPQEGYGELAASMKEAGVASVGGLLGNKNVGGLVPAPAGVVTRAPLAPAKAMQGPPASAAVARQPDQGPPMSAFKQDRVSPPTAVKGDRIAGLVPGAERFAPSPAPAAVPDASGSLPGAPATERFGTTPGPIGPAGITATPGLLDAPAAAPAAIQEDRATRVPTPSIVPQAQVPHVMHPPNPTVGVKPTLAELAAAPALPPPVEVKEYKPQPIQKTIVPQAVPAPITAPVAQKPAGIVGSIFGGPPDVASVNIGSGLNAVNSVLTGQARPGDTAYSRSMPGVSVRDLGNGLVEHTNQYGVKSYTKDGNTQGQGLFSHFSNPFSGGIVGSPAATGKGFFGGLFSGLGGNAKSSSAKSGSSKSSSKGKSTSGGNKSNSRSDSAGY